MKKRFLFLVALFCSFVLSAQQLPNSSFENWEHDALNNFEDGQRPVNWNTSNIKKTVVGITAGANMVFPDGNAHSGAYCAKAVNTEVGAAGITETSPAWFTMGKPWSFIDGLNTGSATAGTDGGIQFTYRPDTIAVWIKRTSSGNENAHIVFYSWKGTSRGDSYKNKNNGCSSTTHYDEESDIRQFADKNECSTTEMATQVAEAMWRSKETFTEWTEIKIPIKYLTNDKPEKCNMIISAANYPNYRANTVELGAAIWADDVRLIYSSSVDEVYVDGRKKLSCKSGELDYTCSMGKLATEVGEITLKRSGRWLDASEYTVKKGAIGEVTTITVKAEDGSSTSTYNITFAAAMSSNPNLGDILVGGSSISGFNPLITSYNVELPFGTTTYPVVEAVLAEDGQKADVSIPATFPGIVKILTTAPDGVAKKEYLITFTVGALTDNTLTDISLNGKTISGFNPTKNNYTIELPLGTTETPQLGYTTAYPEHHDIVVDNQGVTGGITIKVTPKGTTNTRTYKIKFVVTESTNSKLASITLDGKEIDGFYSELLSYTVNLPIGTTELPVVGFEKGDMYQEVSVEMGGFDNPTKITVKSQSGAQTIYRITFVIAQSSISTLNDIQLDGVSITDFDPTKTSYEVELPQGTTVAPKITYVKGDEYQTVTLTEGGLNGTTRIVVVAQSGAVTTYAIEFKVVKSSNSTLNAIMLDGVLLEGFASDVTSYNVVLLRGTTKLPEITWIAGDASQTIRKTDGGINGETKITVKAQTGDVTVYSIFFRVETNSNVNLSDIKIGGVSIPGFDSQVLDYNFVLSAGTTTLPEITYLKGDEAQSVSITRGGVNGATEILVKAEDGTTRIYTIIFSVLKSENAFLKMIYIDSVALSDFEPEKLEYDYVVTSAITQCPDITVDKENGQNISITVPRVTGTARIEVTPESGSKNVYTINISYPESSNSRLANILVDGVQIEGWNPEVIDYKLQITDGKIPVVTCEQGDDKQHIVVESNVITGDTKFIVKAENGSATIYSVIFERVKSSIATLADIKVGGESIFDVNKFDYDYVLSEGTTQCPDIIYVKGDEKQNVTLVSPALDGKAKLIVVSEDVTDTTIYTINFAFKISSNTDLQKIVLTQRSISYEKELLLSDFTSSVVLASSDNIVSDTVEIDWIEGIEAPSISYVVADDKQMVALADAGLNGAEVLVVAEDGSQREYVIRYNIVKTDITQLKDLQMYDALNHEFVSLSGFRSDKYTYDVELPWRTETEPVLNPVAMLPNQTIVMTYGGVNGVTTIVVTAEDGVTQQTYVVNFKTLKSSVATLSAIYYTHNSNAQELPEFDENKFDYLVELPYGTKIAPILTWDLGVDNGKEVTEQKIEYEARSLYEPSVIKVTADDGSNATYTIRYKVADSGKENILRMISVGDKSIVVEDGVFDYEVELPFGTKDIPTISVAKAFEEQSVLIASKGLLGGTKIEVYSNKEITEKTVYNIKYRVSKVSYASLSSILIDGVNLSNFNPGETTYVVNVTTPPTSVEAIPVDGAELVESPIFNSHKAEINVVADGGNEEKTYYVYFHYKNDVIPNGDFRDWVPMGKYSAKNKPQYWTTAGDIVGDYSDGVGGTPTDFSTTISNQTSGGVGIVGLHTINSGTTAGIGGSFPGMMTLGSMSVSPSNANGTTSSVSGGVTFRNTPDEFRFEANPKYNSNINTWRVLFRIGNNLGLEETLHTGNYQNKNVWQKVSKSIRYGVGEVNTMNIVLNSAGSENATDVASWLNQGASILWIKNLELYYNNRLSSIIIDGVALEDFDSGKLEYTYDIDAERQTLPEISVIGQVADQQHRIVWGDEVNRERVATIVCMAEDGMTIDYKIKFIRGKSTNKLLKSLKVNGVLLEDFSPNKLNYTYHIPAMTRIMPDVEAIGDNYNQKISYSVSESKISIQVRAEEMKNVNAYEITFVKDKDTIADLKNIMLEGFDLGYDTTLSTYNVNMLDNSVIPYIYFEKMSEAQNVDVIVDDSSVKLHVVASDEKTTADYVINFVYPIKTSTAQLKTIDFNGYQLDGFASDNYDYTHKFDVDPLKSLYYEKVLPTDVITQVITPDSILLKIQSADASIKNKYCIIYDVTLSNDATLESLTYDYRPMEGFTPALTDYPMVVNRNEFPHVVAKAFHSGSSIEVDYFVSKNEERIFAFGVKSEDKTKSTTSVRMTTPKGESAVLGGIFFNGEAMRENGDGYTSSSVYIPEVKEYNIKLHSEFPKMKQPVMPNITAIAGEYGQKVEIENGGINGDTYIVVTSESGIETTYVLKFTSELSSNVFLNDLLLNYETIKDFQPKRYFYQIKLQQGSNMPTVSWQAADAYQTIDVKEYENRIDVKVTAEDGSFEVYQIDIEWLPSNETNIETILSDGKPLEGFDPTIYDYFFDLPVGTSVEPMLKVVAGADGQSISITSGGIDSTTVISVTAPDGVSKRDYRIHYNLLMSENNKLAMIFLNGDSLSGFDAMVRDYTITLSIDEDYPVVTWATGDDYQNVTRIVREDNTVVLTVVPQRAELQYEYIIRFNKVASKSSNLLSIEIDGEVIEGFSPDKYTYLIDLPIGTEDVPYISYTKSEEAQTVYFIEPATINDVATIKVVAQDATYSSTYYVAFNRLLSDVDTLKNIFLGGIPIEYFDADSMEYVITLPYGTDEMPTIEYEVGDKYQRVEVLSENLSYIIVVTAENAARRTYKVKFEIEKSSNALLKAINNNGVLLEAFDPEVFEYEIVLPYGVTTLPILTYELAEFAQTIKYRPAVNINDTALFEVTAENGINKTLYHVCFKTVKSDNAFLSNIIIGGEPLTSYARSFESDKDFDSEEFIYNIILPYGTTKLPQISWVEMVDDYESIEFNGGDINGTSIISVTSADGRNVNDYYLNFSVRKSDNAYLKTLSIENTKLDFDSVVFEYIITFPIGTDTASLPTKEDVMFEQVMSSQVVEILQETPTEITVLVTAEDGITMNAYQIKFEILLSNNTLLKDLRVSGVSIANFSSTQYEYTYMLFPGASVPEIDFEKAEEAQDVDITYGNVDEATYIYVEAEDGTLGTYVINFMTTDRNPGNRPSYDDVSWTTLGDGYFKASSLRENVKLLIFQGDGTRVMVESVGLVDPNDDIRLPHEGGTVIYLPNMRQIYIYTFVYDNKVIASGKFVR